MTITQWLIVANFVIMVLGLVWTRSRNETSTRLQSENAVTLVKKDIKAGLDGLGQRIQSIERRLDAEVKRCSEKQSDTSARVKSLENKDILTFSLHEPMQEKCRTEIFRAIKQSDHKVDTFEGKITQMSRCLHNMDKKITRLLALRERENND